MRPDASSVTRLVLIGVVAGLFSTLFGVGGGILIVPLLMLVLGYPAHAATATSLGAILLTALAGAAAYAVRGEVDLAHAAVVGIPAVAGALAGSALQRRVPARELAVAFALLLAAVAVWLIAG